MSMELLLREYFDVSERGRNILCELIDLYGGEGMGSEEAKEYVRAIEQDYIKSLKGEKSNEE